MIFCLFLRLFIVILYLMVFDINDVMFCFILLRDFLVIEFVLLNVLLRYFNVLVKLLDIIEFLFDLKLIFNEILFRLIDLVREIL